MDDLIAFLKARLNEEEQAAQALMLTGNAALGQPGKWSAYLEGGEDGWAVEDDANGMAPGIVGDKAVADFLADRAPARALRDVEAKRLIISELWDEEEGFCTEWTASGTAWAVLCRLALPYDDHPDYRQEWRP